ncbi:MAG: NADH-quinone oxidoreductase subunit K [Phycisphaerales bacterium]|nr:NADH-quinone oxidoreductase subunit K [Phycisphaerales bacterium]
MSIALAIAAGALYGAGVYLLMRRALTRIVLGLALLAHGANLLILAAGGAAGRPPFAGEDPAGAADPLPQALILTAIVISFATTAFLLTILVVTHRRTATLLVDELARIDRPAPPVATTIDA